MAVNVSDATAYIANYCIDNEDFLEAETARKQTLLNVAERELKRKYPTYTIPDEAIYETANVLAIKFNDTNKLSAQGVQSFSVSGVASFTFKQASSADLSRLIPQTALDIIGDANGVKLSTRRVGRAVL
ncbi:hypothetical protein [Brevibacillus thermoruber]|uniref:hypothetical protein n=1 Tax=Brevibacillus thermoruber TaxID=33942 RepID=UPI00041F8530|nr:hypothetical protein [Brevibacillus thermoruber]